MASTNPPIRATAYTTYVSVVSQADTKLFKTSVTLATGDVKVSKDGGSFNNIGTLPVEISTTGVLSLALTGTEMTADTVVVLFRDASGAEWADLQLTFHTVAANFDALNTDIDAILADTGTDGVVVASIANGAITAAAIATGAIDADAIADNAIDAGAIASDAITAAKIAAGAITSAKFASGAITADAIAADAIGASELAADAVAEIADAVWDEATTSHTTSGTFGEQVKTDVDAILADTAALPDDGALTTITNNVAAILVDTNELQTDLTNGGRLDLLIDATLADTNELQTDWANGGRLDLIIDATATASALSTVAGYVDTEVASVLTAVDTEVAAIKVVTDALTAAAATKLALSAGTIVTGNAITGTLSTTAFTTDLTEATSDHFNGRIVIFTSGVLTAQASDITDYDGATKTVTVTAMTEAPSNGDDFVIV
jgi:hypothetical protein